MRFYILTNRESQIIKKYLRDPNNLSKEEYNGWCQLRHQFRRNEATIREDLKLLEQLMEARC